jgi:hypothetical protein
MVSERVPSHFNWPSTAASFILEDPQILGRRATEFNSRGDLAPEICCGVARLSPPASCRRVPPPRRELQRNFKTLTVKIV